MRVMLPRQFFAWNTILPLIYLLFMSVCRLASEVSALGLCLVIKHRYEDKLDASTRSN
jgi:hypothetical protein